MEGELISLSSLLPKVEGNLKQRGILLSKSLQVQLRFVFWCLIRFYCNFVFCLIRYNFIFCQTSVTKGVENQSKYFCCFLFLWVKKEKQVLISVISVLIKNVALSDYLTCFLKKLKMEEFLYVINLNTLVGQEMF